MVLPTFNELVHALCPSWEEPWLVTSGASWAPVTAPQCFVLMECMITFSPGTRAVLFCCDMRIRISLPPANGSLQTVFAETMVVVETAGKGENGCPGSSSGTGEGSCGDVSC